MFKKKKMFCPKCQSVDVPTRIVPGSMLMELACWVMFLFPGLIYSMWRHGKASMGCPVCHNPEMIPCESPAAK